MKDAITIFTDGGARGNPGPSGAGAVIYNGEKKIAEVSKFLGHQTNNFAEYEALTLALLATVAEFGSPIHAHVIVKMDSELIVKQMKREYRVKNPVLKEKYANIAALILESFPNISFTHIRRELNKEADKLANDAMDRRF